jgi:putative DNA primase/helicase
MTINDRPSADTVRAALDAIPPDEGGHDQRVRLAFAVWDAIGDAGAELWLSWAGGRSKPDAAEDRATWRSARKPGPVKAGTLFGIAKDYGFRFDAEATAKTPTQAELKAQAAARRAAAEREDRERTERQRAAAIEAAKLWESAAEVKSPSEAPYLERKGVGAHGVRRLADGTLCVPLRDADLKLWNLQTIAPAAPADGGPQKRFLRGGRKSGLWHWIIGNPRDFSLFLIAEGYATGATIHEATGRTVAVAFDAGNVAHVVRALRGRWPAARLLICGDDDADTESRTGKNPGRLKATEAARLARGAAVFPEGLPAGGSDFNDLHAAAGLDAVRVQIEAAIQAAESAAAPGRGKGSGTGAKASPAARKRPARGDGDDDEAGGRKRGDRFRVDDAALWFDSPADDGGDGRPVRVCAPLRVTARARDAHDTGAALLLEFDAFGKPRRWLMPLSMLAGDGTAYRAELLTQGFMAPTDSKRRALLTTYLQGREPAELLRTVDRVGWHGRAYVLPRETLGEESAERIMFTSEAPTEANFGQRGTVAQWQERIGRLCVGNSRLTFAASCAFGAPLLAWAPDTDAGGFNLYGSSGKGKTTAARLAASVNGGADPPYMQAWRSTDNGLEGVAAQHSDALLVLDELAGMEPRTMGAAAYLLANGQGKSRAGRTGAARPRLTWRLIFFSTAEKPLAQYMAEAGQRAQAGQESRMADFPAEVDSQRGIFESLHEFNDGHELATYLKAAVRKTYGAPGRAWLVHLTAKTEGLARTLHDRMERAEGVIVPELASGQVKRVGRRFALVAAAGEMATDAGFTGWPPGTATKAAHRCFNDWVETRTGGIGLSEDAAMLARARAWFQAHGQSARFPDFERREDDHAPQAINQAGWRRRVRTAQGMVETTGYEWFVFPEIFRAELCSGGSDKPLLRLLDSLGHVHREKRDGFTCGLPVDSGTRQRVYRIKPSIMGDVDTRDPDE